MPRKIRIVLILACGVLVGIAWVLPNCIKARTVSSKNACHANLMMIDGAKATWALENKKTYSDIPTEAELYGPTNYIRDIPYCPSSGLYTIGRIDQKPRCSSPWHGLFLACAEIVDESGGPLAGVRVEGRAASSTLRGKTDRRGFCELKMEYDVGAGGATEQFVVSKRGYRTETLQMPEMWPLRVILKKEKN